MVGMILASGLKAGLGGLDPNKEASLGCPGG